MRRFAGILLACSLALSCSFLPVGAVEVFDDFPANMTVYLDEFTLAVDDLKKITMVPAGPMTMLNMSM